MLLQLLPTEIEQRCDICGVRRSIPLNALSAGVEVGDPPEPADPNVIAIPPCDECRAQEFMNRVASTQRGAEPGGTDDIAEHRRGVNALHALLVAEGRTTAALRAWFAVESISTENAAIPWAFPGEPSAVARGEDGAEAAFAEFVASRRGGG